MDVDHIPPGVDFAEHLNSQLAACSIILVVIGPGWLAAKDEAGQRRLDQPDDFVAIEIATALDRNIRVIPVLVNGAGLPKARELPDKLKRLARRQSFELRQNQFGRDADELVERIRGALDASPAIRARRVLVRAIAVTALLLIGWFGVSWISESGPVGSIPSIVDAMIGHFLNGIVNAGPQEVRTDGQRSADVKTEQEREAKERSDAPPLSPSLPTIVSSEKFTAADIPFIGDSARATLAKEYAPAPDFKAFSLNLSGSNAFVTGQPSERSAKTAAVEQCQKRADTSASPRKCELYAVGDTVVYAPGKPPMPPLPWIRHDPSIEQPFIAKNIPLIGEARKERVETLYSSARRNKALAIGPDGKTFFFFGVDSAEEAVRRALESCGGIAGVPCLLVTLNDSFVVPIPTTLKVTGFFKAAGNTIISADARDDVARWLADAPGGWNAVAVGTAGWPGLALKVATEQAAVNGALDDCMKHDSNCRVIAIGPFSVEPNSGITGSH